MASSMPLYRAIFSLGLVASYVAAGVAPGSPDHQIHDLPGYNDSTPIDFKHYAGRLPLPSSGQELFYWLVESQDDPATDPIVLWLNGGPGCSSLGGFFTELGPFVVQSDLTVKRNKYAWNRHANMVFLEAPAGVGFSQPLLTSSDYNDHTTAANTHEFLRVFFDAYPSFQYRPFYIAGESYAGRYIPFLITKLLASPLPKVHLAGFLIGNPSTNYEIDHNSYVDYYYTHGLISLENYMAVGAACGDNVGRCVVSSANCSAACEAALQDGILSIDEPALNRYYIYGDVCLLNNSQAYPYKYRNFPSTHSRVVMTPCADTFTVAYLRQPLVQQALHLANADVIEWSSCSDPVEELYQKSASSMELYPAILAAGIKALIYSGDADMVVNFMGTQRWISSRGLRLNVTSQWRAWFGPDKQLAGYSEEYAGGLTFKTVKGAGHMVPATKPLHALYMFECFVFGQSTCDTWMYPKDNVEYLTGDDVAYIDDSGSASNTGPRDDVVLNWSLYGMLVVFAGIAIIVLAKKLQDRRTKEYTKL
ncbi:hypothetical protein H257_11223 [Aphanomyces astaci]|uniref:Carboxypeptidase n=3 Tax=Aphanomyces astaci TaxID=112090 RepID=W4G5H6_APHAT|nr:hypothetical protein H257_11223 [Aphanomyces astaci]ETV74299.1 hypothetical protein H257_11223 [Aphanomyces astaci]|eukprot:XP_009836405.1 hypothetical protein H257_11223 [Aphanomyces astaci]